MNSKRYLYSLHLKNTGQKLEANRVMNEFIDSFTTEEEKDTWVDEFLKSGEYGHQINHDLYARLVFPVLLKRYSRQERESMLWLAKTIQNLARNPSLLKQVGKGEYRLLLEAYTLLPDEETRQKLLTSLYHDLEHAQHEWPAGILFGINGATSEECEEYLKDVAFARTLDDGGHAEFLDTFEARVKTYRERFQIARGS